MIKVYACLVGDLFHPGHVNFLRQAREQGDFLLAGVCSDEDCDRYKRRPIMTLAERAAVIGSCRYVDDLLLAPPSVVDAAFLDQHDIDLLVHGDDSNQEQLRHFYGESMRRGAYRSLPYTAGISTGELLRRVLCRRPDDLTRKKFLD